MDFGEPAPKPNNLPSMHDLVIEDMQTRRTFGLEKYGTLLQPFNGRNALKDAYEEVLDLAVYLRQKLYEMEPLPQRPELLKRRCYCGGPEEQIYGHVYGEGYYCSRKVTNDGSSKASRS